MRVALASLLFVLYLGTGSPPQGAVITLMTSDVAGGIVSGAEVVLQSTTTSTRSTATTNGDGEVQFSVTPGSYQYFVTARGFKVLEGSVEVKNASDLHIGLKLQLPDYGEYSGPCCFDPPNLPLIAPEPVTAMLPETPEDEESLTQETQVRGFWVDRATGLMWAGKDSGKDLSWKKAVSYCESFRLAGYSDWRLANLWELQGIYDSRAESPGLAGKDSEPTTWHVKGNLFLTAHEWSSSDIAHDQERRSGYRSSFDFNEGKSNDDPAGRPYPFRRALCVRSSARPRDGRIKP